MFGEKYFDGMMLILAFSRADQIKVWKQHYENDLSIEFSWNSNSLLIVNPVSA